MAERHRLVDDKVYVYQRANGPYWQCAVYLNGRSHRRTTCQERLPLAMAFARDWYED